MNDDAPNLRARRRLDTLREIHRAALELIEEHGYRGTTVQQIAHRAGVSPRTFFRYFASKEQAALPGQRRLVQAIDLLQVESDDMPSVLREVESTLERVIAREDDPKLEEHGRIARLLAKEPELQAAATAQERALTERLQFRLAEQAGAGDPMELRLIAEVAIAVWRTSWERWGELTAAGESEDPVALYRQSSAALRSIAAPAPGSHQSRQ